MDDKEKQNLIGQYMQQLDKLLSYETAFFTNLLLLGFDVNAEQKKHGIPFTSQMFKTPNSKAMEVVFYFLLIQLDPIKTAQDFKGIWPIHDKQQQREFKIKVLNYLTQLETSDGLGKGIPPNLAKASLIQTCSGERFYQLLFFFSTYVLCVQMQKEFPHVNIPQFPSLNPIQMLNYHNVMRKSLQTQIGLKAHKFLRSTGTAVHAENTARSYLEDLQRERNLIQFHMDTLKQQFTEFGIDVDAIPEEELEQEIERTVAEQQQSLNEQLESLRTVWETLTHFHSDPATVQKRETIKNIMHKKKNPYELHNTDLAFHIPNLLSIFHSTDNNTQIKYQNLQHQLDKIQPYKEGKLDLAALVDVWTISMEALSIFLKDKDVDFSSLSQAVPTLTQHANNHTDYLSSLKALHAQVLSQIQKVEEKLLEDVPIPEEYTKPKEGNNNNLSGRDEGFIGRLVPPTPIKHYEDSPELSPISSPSLSRNSSPVVDHAMLKKVMDSVRRVAVSKRVNSAQVQMTPFARRLDDVTPSPTPTATTRRPQPKKQTSQTTIYKNKPQTTIKNLQTPLPRTQQPLQTPLQPMYQRPRDPLDYELERAAEEFAEQMMQFTEGREINFTDFDMKTFSKAMQSPKPSPARTPKKASPIDPKEASVLEEAERSVSENREFLEMMQNSSNLSFDQIALSPARLVVPDEPQIALDADTDFDWMKDDLIDAETRMLLNSDEI
mmetsp:Transcript_21705/g.30372  ORF Transcript_21705/g.30372 Transcript_21705/m.30372 type:complete len:719 (+) Transcript_21705:131-2287(+)